MFPLKDAYPFKTANASHAAQAAPHSAGTLEAEMITQYETSCGKQIDELKHTQTTDLDNSICKTLTWKIRNHKKYKRTNISCLDNINCVIVQLSL